MKYCKPQRLAGSRGYVFTVRVVKSREDGKGRVKKKDQVARCRERAQVVVRDDGRGCANALSSEAEATMKSFVKVLYAGEAEAVEGALGRVTCDFALLSNTPSLSATSE